MVRTSWRRCTVIILAVAFLFVPAGRSVAGPVDDLAGQFLDALAELGPKAPVASARAADRGFDGDQIFDAILDLELKPNGKIVSEGEAVSPAGPPAGVVAGDGSDGDVTVAQVNKAAKRAAREISEDADLTLGRAGDRSLLATLIVLASLSGYSPEQIILDGLLADPPAGFRAGVGVGIVDADEIQVVPAATASTRISDTDAFLDDVIGQLEEASARGNGGGKKGKALPLEDGELRYQGTGSYTQSGAPGTCTDDAATFEATVSATGFVSVRWTTTSRINLTSGACETSEPVELFASFHGDPAAECVRVDNPCRGVAQPPWTGTASYDGTEISGTLANQNANPPVSVTFTLER